MKQFLFIYRNPKDRDFNPSPEEMEAIMGQWYEWHDELISKGQFVASEPLKSEGKVISPNNIVTDGPYVEAKELIAGFTLIKAESMEEALKIVKGCPMLIGGEKVEIREILSY